MSCDNLNKFSLFKSINCSISSPQETPFDLRKTRFKKITVFLKEMESKGCIRTKEYQKGVLSITDISKENDL